MPTPEESEKTIEQAKAAMLKASGRPSAGNGPVQVNVITSLEAMAERHHQDWAHFIGSVRDFARHMRTEAEALERWLGTK